MEEGRQGQGGARGDSPRTLQEEARGDSPLIEVTDSFPPPNGSSDHSLVLQCRAGNQDAATHLYLRYAKRLLALVAAQSSPELATRVEPEDLVQSVFRS